MMETPYPRERNHFRTIAWVVLNGTPIRSVLAEPIVGAVRMVIANVVLNQPSQVLFVQRNHMVRAIAGQPSPSSGERSRGNAESGAVHAR